MARRLRSFSPPRAARRFGMLLAALAMLGCDSESTSSGPTEACEATATIDYPGTTSAELVFD